MKNQNNNENKKPPTNRTGNTKNCGGGKSRNCKGSANEHEEEEDLTHKTAVTAEERRAFP